MKFERERADAAPPPLAEAAPGQRAPDDLERRLDEFVRTSRAAWPTLTLDEAPFRQAVLAHLDAAPARTAEAIAALHGPDLYLATACARGDSAAIAAFERHLAPVIGAVVARFARSAEQRDELRQLLREHLFVGRARPARIADYAGRGFLENWLRVTAVRAFLNARRGDAAVPTAVDADTLAALPDRTADLELGFLKAHYRAAFRSAFAAAVASLGAGERLVLRLAMVRAMSVDQVGAVLGVHRATAARRIGRARDALLRRTRDVLAAALAIDDEELTSIIRLVDSQLDASIARLLRGSESDG